MKKFRPLLRLPLLNRRTSNLRRALTALLAVFAVASAALLFAAAPASTRARQDRSAGLRTVGNLPGRSERWALIIGVDNYQKDISPLHGSVNDAKALRDTLVRYAGFPESQIILMTTDSPDADMQPTRGNVLDALDKLSRQVSENGLLLFSFSGHGLSIGADAFIVPSDGKIYQSADLMRERSIDVLRVRRAIEATGVKQVLMLIDACRNYPLKDRGESANPLTEPFKAGFSFDRRNSGVLAFATIFATSLGDRAFEFYDDGARQYRGYFSYAIERGLSGEAADSGGEVTLSALVRYMEESVKRRAYVEKNQRQVPFAVIEGYKSGELVLSVVNKTRPSAPPAAAAAAAVSPWESFRAAARSLSRYEYVGELSQGLARAKINGKWGFVNRAGDVVVAAKYDSVCSFSEGLACAGVGEKVGFIDETGRQVSPIKYDAATRFADGLASAMLNGKVGFIDKSGKTVIPFKYDNAGRFSEGLAMVKLDDKAGFINKSGGVVIPFQYDYAGTFSEGLAEVGRPYVDDPESGEPLYEYGYIDKTGKVVVEMKYHNVGSFSEGMAVVVRAGKQGYINKSGREVIPLEYDAEDCECGEFSDGLGRVTLDGKYGFVNVRGSEVIPIKYDNIWCDAFRKEGFIGVELNGRKGFVDVYGNEHFDF